MFVCLFVVAFCFVLVGFLVVFVLALFWWEFFCCFCFFGVFLLSYVLDFLESVIVSQGSFILFWRTSDLLLNSTQMLINRMSFSGVS